MLCISHFSSIQFRLLILIQFPMFLFQVVGPSDGSNYVIDYYGSRLIKVNYSNDTYLKPQWEQLIN